MSIRNFIVNIHNDIDIDTYEKAIWFDEIIVVILSLIIAEILTDLNDLNKIDYIYIKTNNDNSILSDIVFEYPNKEHIDKYIHAYKQNDDTGIFDKNYMLIREQLFYDLSNIITNMQGYININNQFISNRTVLVNLIDVSA